MNWPWVSRADYETLRQQFGIVAADLTRLEKDLTRVRAHVESWEKAVLLAQVMQPQPIIDAPPSEPDLPAEVLKALRQRAQPGTALFNELVEDAAAQLAAGLTPDEVINDQLRGAKLQVW